MTASRQISPCVGVSLVTYYSDLSELTHCLESLRSPYVARIDVVDNSSSTAIRDFCSTYPDINYIPHPNKGYGAGHNVSIRRSMEEQLPYHLVLNTDLVFSPGVIDGAVEYMLTHVECGLVHPRMIGLDGGMQYTARRLPDPIDLILRRFLPKGWLKAKRARYLLHNADLSKPLNVPYVQGSFMLLRTKALKECGFFDERFFMYPEDIDLTRRIHALYTTMRLPWLEVMHCHRAASYHSPRMLLIHIVNMIKYFNKWGWVFDADRNEVNHALDRRISNPHFSSSDDSD